MRGLDERVVTRGPARDRSPAGRAARDDVRSAAFGVVRLAGERRELALVALVTVVGGYLRFSDLGRQSFWIDELVTVDLLTKPLSGMFAALPTSESSPPLYYVLAWLWARAAGTDEVALRSLSALLGTATIPVAYAAGRALLSRRGGLVAASLAAASPLLVWYSQEARAYALFVLLAALSFVFFVRALDDPSTRTLGWWAAASSASLLTHYFGVFLVAAEAALLLARHRRRPTYIATAGIAGVGLAVLPLAGHQAVFGSSSWVRMVDLPLRAEDALRQLVLPSPPTIWAGAAVPEDHLRSWWIPAIGLLGAALLAVLALGSRRQQRRTLVAFGVGATALGAPLVLSVVATVATGGRGDVFLYRNVIGAWLPLTLVVAAACTARRAGPLGLLAAAALVGWSLAVVFDVRTSPQLQRDDWRALSRALSRPGDQLVVLSPSWEIAALEFHRPALAAIEDRRVEVDQIDLVTRVQVPSYSPAVEMLRPPRGFTRQETQRVQGWIVTRYRAEQPVPLAAEDIGVIPGRSSRVILSPPG